MVEEETVRVDVADPPAERLTLVGFRVAVRPDGETEDERETLPEKLLRLARFIVEVVVEPD